jgi:hypothetical protein
MITVSVLDIGQNADQCVCVLYFNKEQSEYKAVDRQMGFDGIT